MKPSLSPGERVDQFEVVRLIGRGGNGDVYLARDLILGRRVALKVVSVETVDVDRFLAEARATAKLQHPHIVVVHAAGMYAGRPYLALEYIDGTTLRARMESDPPSPRESLRIGLAIADALAEAHRRGILHRDLKPENVMLAADGRLRLVDFGLAHRVEQSTDLDPVLGETSVQIPRVDPDSLAGTPLYMAPEQWAMETLTPATDMWAFGVILFELIAGHRPFTGRSMVELSLKVSSPSPAPTISRRPGVPEEVARLVNRTLDKRPSERPTAEELVRALSLAVHPGRVLTPELAERGPFLGLRAFTEKEADLFFGREAEIVGFLARLRSEPLLAIVGPSGAGKSSFVRAGVLPRLPEQGPWSIVQLRPGARPFQALAQRLVLGGTSEKTVTHGKAVAPPLSAHELADRLLEAPDRLALELRSLGLATGTPILLFVDQLEELHALCPDPEIRRRFMRAISTSAEDPADPVRVVLTIRDDFLGKLAEVEEARAAMSRIFLLRAPAGRNLREVVERPLALTEYAFDDPTLPDAIAKAVEGEPASLPLVQFACEALWERRDQKRRLILRSAYDEIGGVEGALAKHGESVLDQLSPSEVRAAHQILLRMVTEEGTRRTISSARAVEGLDPSASSVLDRLIEARLVTVRRSRASDEAKDAGADVELAHESLTRTWTRLARWIDEGKEEIAMLSELVQAAELWERRGQHEDEAWSGETLRDARSKIARLSAAPPQIVSRFIESGEKRERGRVRRTRASVAILVFVLAAASMFFYRQKEDARRARALAERESAEAAFNDGELWQARAKLRGALEIDDSLEARALWIRLEAEPLVFEEHFSWPADDLAFSPDGKALLVNTEEKAYAFDTSTFERKVLRAHADKPAHALAMSSSGRWLAFGAYSGAIDLVDSVNGAAKPLMGHSGTVWRLAFSSDERHLASTSWDGSARVWSVPEGTVERVLEHKGRVFGLSFNRDGSRLATASSDKTARIWDLRTGHEDLGLRAHAGYVTDVQFASGDALLFSIASDAHLGVWDASTGALRELRPGFSDTSGFFGVGTAEGTADGTLVAVDNMRALSDTQGQRYEGRLRWLSAADLSTVRALPFVPMQLNRAVLDPRGRWIGSVGQDLLSGTVYVHRAQPVGFRAWSRRSYTGGAYGALAVAPEGNAVVIGTARAMLTRDVSTRAIAQSQPLFGAAAFTFSHEGRMLAVATAAGGVRVLDTKSGSLRSTIELSSEVPPSLSFTPEDDALYASDLRRGDVRRWDAASGRSERVLRSGEILTSFVVDPKSKDLVTMTAGGLLQRWNAQGRAVTLGSHPGLSFLGLGPGGGNLFVLRFEQARLDLVDVDRGVTTELRLAERVAEFSCKEAIPGTTRVLYSGADSRSIRSIDLATGEDRLVTRGAQSSCSVSNNGRILAAATENGAVGLFSLPSGRRMWRAPALLPGEILTETGWHRLDRAGQELPFEGEMSAWKRSLASSADNAEPSSDGRSLCVETSSGAVELWDLAQDRRVFSQKTEPLDDLAALPKGCVTLKGGEVRLYFETGASRPIASDGTSIAKDGNEVLVTAVSGALVIDGSGATRPIGATPRDSTAVGRVAGRLVAGLSNGSIVFVSEGWTLEGLTRARVTRVSAGPRGTIVAGHADGTLAIMDPPSGRMLVAAKLEGSIAHVVIAQDVVTASTDLGDHAAIDVSPLTADYCALLNQVWAGSPSLWEQGHAVSHPVPSGHRCAR